MGRILTVTLSPALDLSTETPVVAPGGKLRCAEPRSDPGGGGVNVSRAIRFLGGDSAPLVAAAGAAGEAVLSLLRAEGLAPLAVAAPGETRRNFSVIETTTGAQYRFVTPGAPWSAADAEAAAALVAAQVAPGDWVVISGSLPPGLAADHPAALARRLAARGARVALDTSGPALAHAAAQGAGLAVLRMDDAEAAELAGAPPGPPEATAAMASALVARGAAEIVAIARGAEGTVVADAAGRWFCRPPKVQVVSAVGAGDSFMAAFTMGLARGDAPERACAFGVAAAAAAVTTPDTRLCDAETVALLLPQVTAAPL
ncbi:1-phosphofructokinase family hexose kinase [Rubrimonas cliftonensis]|uniref:Phosphofructokinase n=1 Tax=Rubrimonas cliftonensis TaxID=89524 RepID=A0A1H4BDL1_9RHOB|nr:hexose kinase [Rubrimonas cliftonensis]SEA46243.1 6-phosphofructokinase [Rubrimonas cliftonensis]